MNFNLPVSIGTFFLYYVISLVALFITYNIGWLIKRFVFKRKETISALSMLTCSVLGLTSLVTVYSIIMTRGLTANWMLLILFLFYLYYSKNNNDRSEYVEQKNSSIKTYLLILCGVNLLFFAYFMYRIVDFDRGLFSPYSFDLDYYAKLSQFLNLGYENGSLAYNFAKEITPQPYHYFELWTNALLYRWGGLNAAVCNMVTLPMLFNSLIFMALLAIIELRKKITIGYILLALVVLLMADVIPYLNHIIPMIKGEICRLSYPKMLPIFLFSLSSITLYLYQQKQAAYFCLLAIPVLNIIPLIAIWGTIGVLLLFDTYKKHLIRWDYWIPFLGLVLLYFIYVLQSPSRSTDIGEPFQWGLLRLYITQPVLYVLAYIHFILLLFVLNKSFLWTTIKQAGIVYIILCFVTITMSIVMRPYHYDATQFVSGSIPIFMYVILATEVLIISTSVVFSLIKRVLIVTFCCISLFISIGGYRDDLIPWKPIYYKYETEVLNKLPIQKEYHIGFYIDENVRLGTGGNYVSGIVDGITIPDFQDYYHNNVYHYSINKGIHNAEYSTDNTPFRDYFTEQNRISPDMTMDEIRLGFMKRNKIEYVRIYKGVLVSEYLLSHLILLATNVENGERFYKINIK